MIENVQRRCTRQLPYLKDLSYPERLKKLKLPTLAYRRIRGDMIETYKIIKGVYDNQSTSILKSWSDVAQRDRGRGHNMRLYLQRSLKPVRQNAFGIRIVKIWNSLPEQVVNSPNVNTFKSRLDKHWEDQEILYNYRAEIKITTVISEKRREDRIESKIGNNVDEND